MIASDWMITKHVCLAKNNVQIRGARIYQRPRSSIFAVHLLSPRPQSLKTTGKRKQMKRLLVITGMIAFLLFAANGLLAQAVTAGSQTAEQGTVTPGNQDNRRVTRVLVGGDSIVQAEPDTAVLIISVVTQGKRAIDAQQENANKSDVVVRALNAAAGAGAEVKTSGYNLQPQRVYKEGQPPTIIGYEARNSVTVTMGDLTKVGTAIDAAGLAGANDVSGISFTLRQDRPARDEALKEATREAVRKARVIAQALGGRVVRIVEVQEEAFERPRPMYESSMNAGLIKTAKQNPIEVGSLDISSRVQLI